MNHLISQSPQIRASGHALGRMVEFGVSPEMVVETVTHPTVTWPANFDRVHLVGARIIVVFAPETQTVVTVKLLTDLPYEHGLHSLTRLPVDLPSAA